jgi:FtsH-binding integral membrane protein
MYGQDPYQPYIQNPNPQGEPNQGYPGQQFNGVNQFGGNGMDPAGYRGIIDGGRQPSNKLSEEEYYDGEQSLSDNARKSFIGKVYALVSIQLLVTTAIGYIGYNSPGFKETFGNTAVVLILSVIMIALSIVIGCCTDFFRRYALSIFIIFTIVVSLLVAVCVSAYKSSVVLLSVGITLVLVIALTIYACILVDI